jgi:hypothetical protein
MMSDRFAPDWSKARPALDSLIETLPGVEHLLVEAFSAVSDPSLTVRSVADVKRNLRAVVGMGASTPWVLYDTIAELLKRLPQAITESTVQSIRINTGCSYEYLRITPDGRWQVAWEVDPSADTEDREVALDWYMPPNHDEAPVVPIPVIDFVAGCVLLLRENLALPAAGILLITLESVLWDALSIIGISRYSERLTYAAVKWKLKRLGDKLVVAIEGADRDLEDLDAELGEYRPIVMFELRKMQAGREQTKVGLRLDVDTPLVGFLASDQVEKSEKVADKGLTIAIQRARSEGIECLQTFAEPLDATLISLRNNLIHLPSHGRLHQPVPIPGEGELLTVDELRANPRLVRTLLPWVVELINTVYTSQPQS